MSVIKTIVLAHFDSTFNANLAELKPLVRGIVYDNTNAHDNLVRFELINDDLCHVHKQQQECVCRYVKEKQTVSSLF